MSFLKAFGNILSGKQPFPVTGQSMQPAAPSEATGPKRIPRISFGRIENHQDGDRLEIFADVHNDSVEETFLDDVVLNGVRRSTNVQLRPSDTRQILLYAGNAFRRQPSGYFEVRYREQSDGDYFMSYYQIRCTKQTNGTLIVSDLRPPGPVKDI